jgi:uncharacterized protein (TIGR03086 family)
MADIRELDARAVATTVALVAGVGRDDLDRPTPCAGWSLADLLAHMTVQHLGFAAAAAGRGADPDAWRVRPLGDAAVAAYGDAAERVVAAFAAPGVLEREFDLPEFPPPGRFPAAQAIGFHFIDYVVHGWDVARALGVPFAPAEDVLAEAVRQADAVPDGERRRRPGAAFRPALPRARTLPAMDRVVAWLGRSPTWPG